MSANYWASTQCNNWLLDRPQLELARKEDLKYATRTECAALGVFFSNLISTICKRLNLRQRVVATSCIFFRRFFAKNSFSALDPFLVSAACIYVSAKVEESPIHIKSAVAEAARSFQEVGFRGMPTDNSSLAEMEFFLLEEMEFDMIVFHPYRSLMALYDRYGKGNAVGNGGGGGGLIPGLGIDAGEFGVIKGLSSVEERDAQGAGGAAGEEGAGVKLAEFDEQVLQMSWFVLNDTYKTDIPLMYPPYLVALAALYLALTLHAPAFERINASLKRITTERNDHSAAIAAVLNNPDSTAKDLPPPRTGKAEDEERRGKEEALTFFAKLNVSLPLLGEVVQEMVSGYEMQKEVNRMVSDGVEMVGLLERMREKRRLELMAKAREKALARAAAGGEGGRTGAHR